MKRSLHKKVPFEFKKITLEDIEKQATVFVDPDEKSKETVDDVKYEVVECEIRPAKIICPDCGGITLEGLDYCDKCGGELKENDT
ncbi:MAG: hypothetical protein Q4G58_04565 [bacterium]|nr:hypothetical protein [bacterium]